MQALSRCLLLDLELRTLSFRPTGLPGTCDFVSDVLASCMAGGHRWVIMGGSNSVTWQDGTQTVATGQASAASHPQLAHRADTWVQRAVRWGLSCRRHRVHPLLACASCVCRRPRPSSPAPAQRCFGGKRSSQVCFWGEVLRVVLCNRPGTPYVKERESVPPSQLPPEF
jgi:hypothetical protein